MAEFVEYYSQYTYADNFIRKYISVAGIYEHDFISSRDNSPFECCNEIRGNVYKFITLIIITSIVESIFIMAENM